MEAGALVVECAELGARLRVAGLGAAGQAVAVAVRPEKIALGAAPAPDLPNRLQGTVREVAYRGEASTYHVALVNGRLVRVTLPNTRRAASELAEGAAVWLGWDAGAGVLLTS